MTLTFRAISTGLSEAWYLDRGSFYSSVDYVHKRWEAELYPRLMPSTVVGERLTVLATDAVVIRRRRVEIPVLLS